MFFLIRCAFWLTIVFHAMTWPAGTWSAKTWPLKTWPVQMAPSQTGVTPGAMLKMASDAASDLAGVADTNVAAKLEQECLKAPADCLALAERLPQIVATTQAPAVPDVLPPKRPWRVAESEAEHPAVVHKALSQHN